MRIVNIDNHSRSFASASDVSTGISRSYATMKNPEDLFFGIVKDDVPFDAVVTTRPENFAVACLLLQRWGLARYFVPYLAILVVDEPVPEEYQRLVATIGGSVGAVVFTNQQLFEAFKPAGVTVSTLKEFKMRAFVDEKAFSPEVVTCLMDLVLERKCGFESKSVWKDYETAAETLQKPFTMDELFTALHKVVKNPALFGHKKMFNACWSYRVLERLGYRAELSTELRLL